MSATLPLYPATNQSGFQPSTAARSLTPPRSSPVLGPPIGTSASSLPPQRQAATMATLPPQPAVNLAPTYIRSTQSLAPGAAPAIRTAAIGQSVFAPAQARSNSPALGRSVPQLQVQGNSAESMWLPGQPLAGQVSASSFPVAQTMPLAGAAQNRSIAPSAIATLPAPAFGGVSTVQPGSATMPPVVVNNAMSVPVNQARSTAAYEAQQLQPSTLSQSATKLGTQSRPVPSALSPAPGDYPGSSYMASQRMAPYVGSSSYMGGSYIPSQAGLTVPRTELPITGFKSMKLHDLPGVITLAHDREDIRGGIGNLPDDPGWFFVPEMLEMAGNGWGGNFSVKDGHDLVTGSESDYIDRMVGAGEGIPFVAMPLYEPTCAPMFNKNVKVYSDDKLNRFSLTPFKKPAKVQHHPVEAYLQGMQFVDNMRDF
mmetsp:Transcript_41189/g.101303  ORF Transcript_41189/g.101303 Transcript_41189/m.101303 type:complete len:426 (+) Transcript_41189:49-1326(+)